MRSHPGDKLLGAPPSRQDTRTRPGGSRFHSPCGHTNEAGWRRASPPRLVTGLGRRATSVTPKLKRGGQDDKRAAAGQGGSPGNQVCGRSMPGPPSLAARR